MKIISHNHGTKWNCSKKTMRGCKLHAWHPAAHTLRSELRSLPRTERSTSSHKDPSQSNLKSIKPQMWSFVPGRVREYYTKRSKMRALPQSESDPQSIQNPSKSNHKFEDHGSHCLQVRQIALGFRHSAWVSNAQRNVQTVGTSSARGVVAASGRGARGPSTGRRLNRGHG